jgi:AcrR family transcriptional regulator
VALQRKFGTQEERREGARSKLINATIELIAERGLLGFSLSDVGGRAGVSRALPGHHFKGRDQLVQAAVTRIFDVDDGSASAGLNSMIDAFRLRLTQVADRDPTSLAFAELVVGPLPAKLAALRDGYRQSQVRLVERQLESARAGGHVGEDLDPTAVAPVLLGQLHAEIIRLAAEGGSGEIFLELLKRSIAPDRVSTKRRAAQRTPPAAKPEIQQNLFGGD